jgi:hypothetical protein
MRVQKLSAFLLVSFLLIACVQPGSFPSRRDPTAPLPSPTATASPTIATLPVVTPEVTATATPLVTPEVAETATPTAPGGEIAPSPTAAMADAVVKPTPTTPPPPTATPWPTQPPAATPLGLRLILHDTIPGDKMLSLSPDDLAELAYWEGRVAWGEVAAIIAGQNYQLDRAAPDPDDPHQRLPEPYRYQFTFSPELVGVTDGRVGFDPRDGEWWAGPLNCKSGFEPPIHYYIKVLLLHDETPVQEGTFYFTVADDENCDPARLR